MIADFVAAMVRAFRRVLLPLVAYYGVTVAIPLANGAAQSGAAFVQHTLVVLVVPLAVIVLAVSGAKAFAGVATYARSQSPSDAKTRRRRV